MRLTEVVKYLIYRTPILRRFMAPRYPYKVSPGQLAALVNLIDETRASSGTVIEIGVAQGDTSVFLLEHLRGTSQEKRRAVFIDTFSGFTPDSISYEVNERGKQPTPYDAFRYGNARLFEHNLRDAGYCSFEIVEGDAGAVNWSRFAPISAVHLDIDLYTPTKSVLCNIWDYLEEGGGVVIDDCLPDSPWDGSLQAVEEFSSEHGLSWHRVGSKGALIRKRSN